MRRSTLAILLLAAAGLAAGALQATGLQDGAPSDPHLKVVPRVSAEQARIEAVTRPATAFDAPERFEERSAGAATRFGYANAHAFSAPSANMPFERALDFQVGNGLFKKLWVSAPASTKASDGLGPLYNARSCQRCHLKDGRGHPPAGPEDSAVSMVLRLSVPGPEGAQPHPVYGSQLQDFSVPGVPAEYRLAVTWEEVAVPLSEGETATLRKPRWRAEDLGYGPLGAGAMLSPRIAPQMIGLGLLEAIPAADILALADPGDADGDGISGRPNLVASEEYGVTMLGRFGLKAGAPTVRAQSADAFRGDIGISSPLNPEGWGDCMPAQTACREAPHGGAVEIEEAALDLVAFYSRNLAVPARRDVADPQVLAGKRVFYEAGCTACHVPKFVTHRLEDRPEQSFQLIWPYTDLLLHDMGAGLADNRPEGRASGREWRTPPLWGIGLTEAVSGHSYFLHDGRARSLLEAVLWHGGEAEAARQRVVEMPAADRAALLRFLGSL